MSLCSSLFASGLDRLLGYLHCVPVHSVRFPPRSAEAGWPQRWRDPSGASLGRDRKSGRASRGRESRPGSGKPAHRPTGAGFKKNRAPTEKSHHLKIVLEKRPVFGYPRPVSQPFGMLTDWRDTERHQANPTVVARCVVTR
jgi:hypothetical protein